MSAFLKVTVFITARQDHLAVKRSQFFQVKRHFRFLVNFADQLGSCGCIGTRSNNSDSRLMVNFILDSKRRIFDALSSLTLGLGALCIFEATALSKI